MLPDALPVETNMAARAPFEFNWLPVKEIWVFPPVKLYPYDGVSPVVVGSEKVVPEGGDTKPIETSSVAEASKPEITKLPGSWLLVLSENVGWVGAVTVPVAARDDAGNETWKQTLLNKAISTIFDIRENMIDEMKLGRQNFILT